MPQLIMQVQELAAKLEQGLLMASFRLKNRSLLSGPSYDEKARERFEKWLDQHPEIRHQNIYPPMSEGTLLMPYMGDIALVVSESRQPDLYKLLLDTWEDANGNPKETNITLYLVPQNYKK